MEHFLNKKSRQKNVFDVFVNQKFFKIQRPRTIENEHSNKLIFVTDELKSNQFESIPVIQNDEIKKVDATIVNTSANEKKLPSEQQNIDVIIPIDKNTKGLTIDDHQIDLVTDIIDDNDVSKDTLKLKKIVQDTVNKKVDKVTQNSKRYRKFDVNNIFKKFKK
jgi:hypothetical protein